MELKDKSANNYTLVPQHRVNPQWNWKHARLGSNHANSLLLILNGIESLCSLLYTLLKRTFVNPQWNWKVDVVYLLAREMIQS